MSVVAARLSEEGLSVPVREGRTLHLPPESWRQVVGKDGHPPVVFKTTKLIELPDEIISPGTYLWSNRDQELYARAESPHMAELAMAHTNSNYGYAVDANDVGELHWLEQFVATVEDGVYMLANWRGMSPEARERLGRRLASVVDVPGMHKPRNPHKIRMRWRVGSSTELRDSRDRPNPGATSAKLASAVEDADKRKREIIAITRFIDGRRVGVRHEITLNESIARQVHAELYHIHDSDVWETAGAASLQDRIDRMIGRLEMVVDAPWRQTFGRVIEDDLRYARQYAGQIQGRKYLDRAMLSLEMLGVYSELADLDTRLSIALDHHPRNPRRREARAQKLAGLKLELESQIRHMPVEMRRGEARPGVDRDFRAPVTDKLYRRLGRANAAWVREDWPDAKSHLRDALAAFG